MFKLDFQKNKEKFSPLFQRTTLMMCFWTLVWAIVVALIIFGIIVWIVGALINSSLGNPIGRYMDGYGCGKSSYSHGCRK